MSVTIDRVAVFYHVARMGTWQKVDLEIMSTLTASGLLDVASPYVRYDCENVELFEFPTLERIVKFAAENDDYAVLYLHTKGVTHDRASINDWRQMMLYWMVDRWRECVAKLAEGYDAVGTTIIDTPVRHFQGNFWWATTKHIRTLGMPRDANYTPTCHNQTERHKAEFWLLSKPAKAYEPYRHRLNPYSNRNPPYNYVGRAF